MCGYKLWLQLTYVGEMGPKWFVILLLGVVMSIINLCTQFQVSIFTGYKDTKGNECIENKLAWGGQRSLEVTSNVNTAHMIPNHVQQKLCIYLIQLSRYSELFVESCQLQPTPPAFHTSTGGDLIGISPRPLVSEN